ncbi:FAD-dependent monooxygenase [Paludisphaera sp.]|uniref:FAD-dependent monooxygenase n=1 Tax=Paludisphaera sp. TaxID=2017432 RepID=UPI00301DF077
MKALIVGGGIGGLAAGVALRRRGWDVAVFERTPTIAAVGAGISLWGNALDCLDRLGVLPALRPGATSEAGAIRADRGDVLMAIRPEDVGATADRLVWMVHRADLHAALLDALGADAVRAGAECVAVGQDDSGAWARFADGTEARGDVLVGADGLRSTVRAALFGAAPPRYAGYTAWRGVCPFDPERLAPGESWGRGRRFGCLPMSNRRAYWFAVADAPEGETDPPGGRKALLLELFRGWHAPVEDLIRATDESTILRNDIYDRPPLRRWSVGRVTLLGDAAHPMTPNLGQGACQAIEDAVVLAQELADATPDAIPAALRRYDARRVPRAARIVRASRQVGAVAQWSNPLACKLRNALCRAPFAARSQARQLAWLLAGPCREA